MRKQKIQRQKKKEMLKKIETYDKDSLRLLRGDSPTTEAMKQSLNIVSKKKFQFELADAKKNRKVTSEKSKLLDGNFGISLGKKPCARDGHSMTLWSDKILVFGGDRFRMCFNDLYSFNATDSIKKMKA